MKDQFTVRVKELGRMEIIFKFDTMPEAEAAQRVAQVLILDGEVSIENKCAVPELPNSYDGVNPFKDRSTPDLKKELFGIEIDLQHNRSDFSEDSLRDSELRLRCLAEEIARREKG